MSEYCDVDFSKIKTYSVAQRRNLVTIENMARPDIDAVEEWGDEDFDLLVSDIVEARKNGRPVIFSMGAHVIKNGLSRYLIEMIKKNIITHIAGNGACSIHDFELAYLGGTSEDVPTAIEDGSFGMWEETGAWMKRSVGRRLHGGAGVWGKFGGGMWRSILSVFRTKKTVFSIRLIWKAYRQRIISRWAPISSTSIRK